MLVRVERIGGAGLTLEEELDPRVFPELMALEETGELRFSAPLSARVHLQVSSNMIEVSGQVASTIETSCSRCLESCSLPLAGEFELTFIDAAAALAGATAKQEFELSSEDLGLSTYEGEILDLTAHLVEQTLLALPAHPVCRESCRGLCSHCGRNLNESSCDCEERMRDNRFAQLKDLRFDK